LDKLTFDALVAFEKKHDLWKYKLFDYPLWIHCREPMLISAMMVERKIKRPKILEMLKSFLETIIFLLTQYKYDKVYFLMERAELLEIYKEDKSKRKKLFLNSEQEKVYDKDDYISSDFFSLLRFLSRKIAFRVFKKKYQSISDDLVKIGFDSDLNKYIQIAMGDALFLKFLSFILIKRNDKIYTGAVIPIGEKFINSLNSHEVQHGVIHSTHIGYINIPKVKNRLLLYSKQYKEVLKEAGYEGQLIINEYKHNFLNRSSIRYFPIVIYTQPTMDMQEAVNNFMRNIKPNNVFIQKHPKDYFNYQIDKNLFITATVPSEVGFPIMYISSIIENFTFFNRDCYIYDLKRGDNVRKFLEVYTLGTESKMIIRSSLSSIYENIMKEI